MNSNPSRLDTTASYTWLFDCIQRLATRTSNPVMEVLQGVTQVEQEHKYPEPGLAFTGSGLRAFYHCHAATTAPANEHGHFHLFLHNGGDREALANWGHLAGLSMDQFGQPLRWFSVNRWVSGGPWLAAPRLVALLQQLTATSELLLVEEWLLAMLAVYQPELAQLLAQRDLTVTQLMTTSNKQAILENRSYYEFSTSTIDLLTKFQQHQ
jgi:hypothetical protein